MRFYTLIKQPIFLEGIEKLLLTKISADITIVRKVNLEEMIAEKEKSKNPFKNEILIYEVVKFSTKEFNHLSQMISFNSTIKILIIASNIRISDVKLLFKIGVMGIINSDAVPNQFIDFIKKILKGNKVLSPEYWDLIVDNFFLSLENIDIKEQKSVNINTNFLLHENLTNREKEISGYICDGKSTREISNNLFLSSHTVETHRRKILNKLGVKNTASMVKVAIKNNLYSL